jgi:hypothetical protein
MLDDFSNIIVMVLLKKKIKLINKKDKMHGLKNKAQVR